MFRGGGKNNNVANGTNVSFAILIWKLFLRNVLKYILSYRHYGKNELWKKPFYVFRVSAYIDDY